MSRPPPRATITNRRMPKTWSVRVKVQINQLARRLFGRRPFAVGPHDLFGEPPKWQIDLTRRWTVFARETNLPFALVLLGVCVGITAAWWVWFPCFLPNVQPEMAGVTMDVFFVLIVFASFEFRRERQQSIERQQETIDDYKRWNVPEAHLRIAGAMRRLQKLGVHRFDLSGLLLTDYSFARSGIKSLAGSIFYDGSWGDPHSDATVQLRNVSFDYVNCRDVTFSPFEPFDWVNEPLYRHALFEDCSFIGSDLRGAVFNGAHVRWLSPPPASHYEIVDEDEFGRPEYAQASSAPFSRAMLHGAVFSGCLFENVDFRDAEGVLEADFSGAKGLETAIFDDEAVRAAVLANAGRPTSREQMRAATRS